MGPRSIAPLLQRFGSARAACAARSEERSEAVGRRIRGRPDLGGAEADLESWRELGVRALASGEADYPPALAAIYDPPPLLYLVGDPSILTERCLAVVGTRRCSRHGRAFATELAADLARHGVTVVSGLAFGIDAAAHRGALGSGRTAAVLGGSTTEIAPARNTDLAGRIVACGGALLSERPPGSRVTPGSFVARNRIVSGLCAGVIVVEAGARSGALHTADFALEQGRTVLAVPGRPHDAESAGTLGLIRDGATPVTSAEQALEAVGWEGAATARPRRSEPADPLVATLAERGPQTVDDLASALGRAANELRVALGRLELDGAVRRGADGRYAATRS